MTSIDFLARAARQYSSGLITAEELAQKLFDSFASDPDLSTDKALEVAALIPQTILPLVRRGIQIALSPGYLRIAFHVGGKPRTMQQEHAAALAETARECAWALALKPLLDR